MTPAAASAFWVVKVEALAMRHTAAEAQEHAQAGAEHRQAAAVVLVRYGRAAAQARHRASRQRKAAEAAERRQERVPQAAVAEHAEHGGFAAYKIVQVANPRRLKTAATAERKAEL